MQEENGVDDDPNTITNKEHTIIEGVIESALIKASDIMVPLEKV